MSTPVFGKEPEHLASPKRSFFDGRAIPYANLAKIRAAMVEDDMRLIDILGSRVMEDHWLEPVVDLSQSAHAQVGQLAQIARPGHIRFPKLVEDIYGVLAPEASPLIDEIDAGVIRVIADRTEKAMLATAFKLDKGEGIAPEQQAKNQARAKEIAESEDFSIPDAYGDFPGLVYDIYGVLVPGTANVLQQAMFAETYLLAPHYAGDAGGDDWDKCLAHAFRDLAL
jgi:hypothetical protein